MGRHTFYRSIQKLSLSLSCKHCHGSVHLVALNSHNITGSPPPLIGLMRMEDAGYDGRVFAFQISGRELHIYGRAFHIHGIAFQKSCQRMFFSIFSAFYIMNGYNLSGQLKQAQDFDSKTHLKKQKPTFRTEISQKQLKYLFLETPCNFSDFL